MQLKLKTVLKLAILIRPKIKFQIFTTTKVYLRVYVSICLDTATKKKIVDVF